MAKRHRTPRPRGVSPRVAAVARRRWRRLWTTALQKLPVTLIGQGAPPSVAIAMAEGWAYIVRVVMPVVPVGRKRLWVRMDEPSRRATERVVARRATQRAMKTKARTEWHRHERWEEAVATNLLLSFQLAERQLMRATLQLAERHGERFFPFEEAKGVIGAAITSVAEFEERGLEAEERQRFLELRARPVGPRPLGWVTVEEVRDVVVKVLTLVRSMVLRPIVVRPILLLFLAQEMLRALPEWTPQEFTARVRFSLN